MLCGQDFQKYLHRRPLFASTVRAAPELLEFDSRNVAVLKIMLTANFCARGTSASALHVTFIKVIVKRIEELAVHLQWEWQKRLRPLQSSYSYNSLNSHCSLPKSNITCKGSKESSTFGLLEHVADGHIANRPRPDVIACLKSIPLARRIARPSP